MAEKCKEKCEVYSRVAGAALALGCLCLTGCSTTKKAVESASGKNLGLDGYVMLGEIETANPETATPQGKIIIGRVTYKSRKVGIPADQKVPTTGYFKATQTESLFGTKETIIEYDFTAGSDADAKKAEETLKAKRKAAEEAFAKDEKKAAAAPADNGENKPADTAAGGEAPADEKKPETEAAKPTAEKTEKTETADAAKK